jgi:hypothetical protein
MLNDPRCQRIEVRAVRNDINNDFNNKVVEIVKTVRVDCAAVLVPKVGSSNSVLGNNSNDILENKDSILNGCVALQGYLLELKF